MKKQLEMKATISSQKRVKEMYIQEGCYITEIWNTEIWNTKIDPQVSIARACVEPGKITHGIMLSDVVQNIHNYICT
jgi:hypothetical protein